MRRLAAFAAGAVLLAAPTSASAGTFTLHPAGFGPMSYASWKGGEGLPDSSGDANEAFYLQKMVPTATVAAGVAIIKGVEGLPTSAVDPLGFRYGVDGHCGAGAPRFNLTYTPSGGPPNQTAFFGCNSGMLPAQPPAMAPNGRVFDDRHTVGPLPSGTVVSLSIVFDEGNDVGQGFVFLDNIQVGQKIWTSAADNGNG